MFETSVQERIENYVYALLDPDSQTPFYIGKGKGNRVFDHMRCALKENKDSAKYETIRKIQKQGKEVIHIIIRHGLNPVQAKIVETALIDFAELLDLKVANKVLGSKASEFGLMTSDEVKRKYKSEPLQKLADDCVLININSTYRRAKGEKSYYEATRASWVIAKWRLPKLKYALSEYRGYIVEVFEIESWEEYPTVDKKGKPKIRWGFIGKVANDAVRKKYLNKSIKKKKGQTNPLLYEYVAKGEPVEAQQQH